MCRLMIYLYFFLFCATIGQANVERMQAKKLVEKYELTESISIGVTQAGQKIELGGFSGLRFLGKTADGKLQFITHTDRGPNPDAFKEDGKIKRPFLLSDFNPRLIFLEVDPIAKTMKVTKQIFLKGFDGRPLTGLPIFSDSNHEQPTDAHGNDLPIDVMGMDLESIELASDGSYWMADEYGPSIVHFSSQGELQALFRPEKELPEIIKQRGLNKGFEGVAMQGSKLFAILQSPLDDLKSEEGQHKGPSRILRIIEFDTQTKKTLGQFAYRLEDSNSDRIGDMVSLDSGRFLIIEQNEKKGAENFKKIFLIDLNKASNLQLLAGSIGEVGKLEYATDAQLEKEGVKLVEKKELLDLTALGIDVEKIEGISLVDFTHIAVITDNDFALSGELNKKTGMVIFKEDKSALYLIYLDIKKL